MIRKYTSAAGFKQALEDRLKRDAVGGFALQRRRQSLVFQRFLARVQAQLGSATLKGGFAQMANEHELAWTTLEDVFTAVARFLDPVLAKKEGAWDPRIWTWASGRR